MRQNPGVQNEASNTTRPLVEKGRSFIYFRVELMNFRHFNFFALKPIFVADFQGKTAFDLRDRQLFFKMLFDYILLEDIDSEKSTMAWSLYQLLKDDDFSDEVFYVGMSYILQKRSEFRDFERVSNTTITPTPKEDVITASKTVDSLEISSYGMILNEFTYKKEDIYTEILKQKIK